MQFIEKFYCFLKSPVVKRIYYFDGDNIFYVLNESIGMHEYLITMLVVMNLSK